MNITLNLIIKILIAVVTLLIIIPLVLYFVLESKIVNREGGLAESLSNSTTTLEVGKQPAELSGKIFLSLSPKSSERVVPSPYIYDIEAGQLTSSSVDTFGQSFKTYIADLNISPNGQWITFKGFKPSDVNTQRWQDWDFVNLPQINRVRLSSEVSVSTVSQAIQNNSEKLTDIAVVRKHSSSVNNKGEILMVSVDNVDNVDLQSLNNLAIGVEDFTIRHISPNNEIKILTKGSSPRWITDDSFVFFKNGGLYLYSMETGKESVMLPFTYEDSEGLFNDVKMNVSDDGRFIAISMSKKKIVLVLGVDLVDGQPVLSNFFKELPVSGFWPTFSPDGEFLVIQGVDVDNIATDPKPFLSFWRTSDFTELTDRRINLDDYRQDYMFVDDWIK